MGRLCPVRLGWAFLFQIRDWQTGEVPFRLADGLVDAGFFFFLQDIIIRDERGEKREKVR